MHGQQNIKIRDVVTVTSTGGNMQNTQKVCCDSRQKCDSARAKRDREIHQIGAQLSGQNVLCEQER